MSATPETASSKETLQNCAEVRFIYVIHGPKNFSADDPLLQVLSDCDLILLEELGGTTESRLQVETGVNLILQNPALLGTVDVGIRNRLLMVCRGSSQFESQLVSRLAGSGKILRYVDVDEQSEAHALDQEAETLRHKVGELLQDGNLTPAYATYRQLVDILARSYLLREETVVSQIPILINETPCPHPKVVGVIQGLAHLETAKLFAQDHPNTQTSLHQIAPFTPCSTRVIQKIRQGETISETDHQRAFLADYVLLYAAAPDINDDNPIDEAALASLYRLVDSLSPDQVSAALSRFELHFKQKAKHFKHFAFGQAVNSLLADLKRWTGN